MIRWDYVFTPGRLPGNVKNMTVNSRRSELTITNFDIDSNTGPYRCNATAGELENSTTAVVVPNGMCSVVTGGIICSDRIFAVVKCRIAYIL